MRLEGVAGEATADPWLKGREGPPAMIRDIHPTIQPFCSVTLYCKFYSDLCCPSFAEIVSV